MGGAESGKAQTSTDGFLSHSEILGYDDMEKYCSFQDHTHSSKWPHDVVEVDLFFPSVDRFLKKPVRIQLILLFRY